MLRETLFITFLCSTICTGSENPIYKEIGEDQYSICFRKLNATDSFGCSSKNGGNTGVVLVLFNGERSTDLQDVDPDHAPYIAILNMKQFSNETFMSSLNENELINGVVVVEPQSDSDRPKSFSVDEKCPNADHSLYKESGGQCSTSTWNPSGNGYFFKKWNFPIILLSKSGQDTLDEIVNCSLKHNHKNATDSRLCALEIKTPMNAVKNSRVCLRRNYYNKHFIQFSSFCDAMYGQNLHTFNTPVVNASKGMILVIARGSSLSMFTQRALGRYSISPAAAILSALASAISNVSNTNANEPKKQILFSVINGESINYYGSTKFVDDLVNLKLFESVYGEAVDLLNVDTIIDLDQLGYGANRGAFYVHTLNSGPKKAENTALAKMLVDNIPAGSKIDVKIVNDVKYPPSSIQAFMKYSSQFSTIMVSDYDKEYVNTFYNSFLDDETPVNEGNLFDLTSSLYKSLVEMIYPKSDAASGGLNRNTFHDIVSCHYNVSSCSIIKEMYFNGNKDVSLISKDMDQSFRLGTSHFLFLTRAITFYQTGEAYPNATTENDCKGPADERPQYTYQWIPGPNYQNSTGLCWRSLQILETVKFDAVDDPWGEWNTTNFSYWTESVWNIPSVKLFLKPSIRWETTVLSTGIIVTLVSILCMVFVLKRFNDLFPETSYVAGTMTS